MNHRAKFLIWGPNLNRALFLLAIFFTDVYNGGEIKFEGLWRMGTLDF